MNHRLFVRSVVALALAVPLAACDSLSTGPSAGETVVRIKQGSSASAALAPSFSAALAAAMPGPVALSDIQAIDVTITRVQALPQGDDAAEEAAWVSLDVAADTRVNLASLPAAAESGIQLARGELQPGTYGNLRIFYKEATITFARDVSVGGGPMAKTFAEGTAYPLAIGSGEQTGIKIPTASFTVAEDAGETVTITFDGSASVRTVIPTPVGVRMAPVLAARGRGGD